MRQYSVKMRFEQSQTLFMVKNNTCLLMYPGFTTPESYRANCYRYNVDTNEGPSMNH